MYKVALFKTVTRLFISFGMTILTQIPAEAQEKGKTHACPDTIFYARVDRLMDSIGSHLEDTFCLLEAPLTKARPESSLSNWMADVVLRRSGMSPQACILSYGIGDTAYIPPGPFRRKDLYTLIGHNDRLVVIEIKGVLLKDLCDSIAGVGGIPVSGLSFSISKRTAQHIRVGQKEIHPHLLYRILLNRKLLYDPHMPPGIYRQRFQVNDGQTLRDMLKAELEEIRVTKKTINAKPDKRIYYEF